MHFTDTDVDPYVLDASAFGLRYFCPDTGKEHVKEQADEFDVVADVFETKGLNGAAETRRSWAKTLREAKPVDWDAIEKAVKQESWKSTVPRGTGRATRLVEEAAATAYRGKSVLVICGTEREVDRIDRLIQEQILALFRKGNDGYISPDLAWRRVRCVPGDTLETLQALSRGTRADVVLEDHYARETRNRQTVAIIAHLQAEACPGDDPIRLDNAIRSRLGPYRAP